MKLVGFSKDAARNYFSKRHQASRDLVEKGMKRLHEFRAPSDKYFWPFVAYLISDQISAEIGDTYSKSMPSKYLSSKELFDRLVEDVMRREITRQDLELNVDDVLELYKEMIIEHQSVMAVEVFKTYLRTLHPNVKDPVQLPTKLQNSPFLDSDGEFVRFRHDFFEKRISAMFFVDSISRSALPSKVLESLSKHSHGNAEFVAYCAKRIDLLEIETETIKKAHLQLKRTYHKLHLDHEKEVYRKASSFLTYLYIHSKRGDAISSSSEEITELLLELNEGKFESIWIFGKFFPIDFSDKRVVDCYFVDYDSFLSCSLEMAEFVDCVILVSDSFQRELDTSNEKTTRLGNLSGISKATFSGGIRSQIISRIADETQMSLENEREKLSIDVATFLKEFYVDREDGFWRHPKSHLIISMKSGRKFEWLFDRMLDLQVIKRCRTGTTKDKVYELEQVYKDSVRSLIRNGYWEARLLELLSKLLQSKN
ncbi:MAG: hypothetical protein U0176_16715 [Bacteroidia bacterium]